MTVFGKKPRPAFATCLACFSLVGAILDAQDPRLMSDKDQTNRARPLWLAAGHEFDGDDGRCGRVFEFHGAGGERGDARAVVGEELEAGNIPV